MGGCACFSNFLSKTNRVIRVSNLISRLILPFLCRRLMIPSPIWNDSFQASNFDGGGDGILCYDDLLGTAILFVFVVENRMVIGRRRWLCTTVKSSGCPSKHAAIGILSINYEEVWRLLKQNPFVALLLFFCNHHHVEAVFFQKKAKRL